MMHPTGKEAKISQPLGTQNAVSKRYSRTSNPPKYVFVNFSRSRRFLPTDGPPLLLPRHNEDHFAPEQQGELGQHPSDPFPTDIYYLGKFFMETFLKVSLFGCTLDSDRR